MQLIYDMESHKEFYLMETNFSYLSIKIQGDETEDLSMALPPANLKFRRVIISLALVSAETRMADKDPIRKISVIQVSDSIEYREADHHDLPTVSTVVVKYHIWVNATIRWSP